MSSMPLYLLQDKVQRLDIDAAQRLCIIHELLPDRRIPIHLVSRIVCNMRVDISSKALIACMKKGIPLAIVERSGRTVGWCFGVRRTENSLHDLLRQALDDPEWDSLYNHWRENQTLAICAQVLLLCQIPATPSARANPRAALCNAHYQKHKRCCGQAVNELAELAQHELASHLAHESADPSLLAWSRPGLNLITDIGAILGLHAHIDIHHASNIPEREALMVWAMQRFERHQSHWQQRIAQLSQAFEKFLRTRWQ